MLNWRAHANALMGFSGVVPDEVIDKSLVDELDIIDLVFILFQELGAEGTVEVYI